MATKVFTGSDITFYQALGPGGGVGVDWTAAAAAWPPTMDGDSGVCAPGGVGAGAQLLGLTASLVDDMTVPPVITLTAIEIAFDWHILTVGASSPAVTISDALTNVAVSAGDQTGHYDASEDPTMYLGGTDRATLFTVPSVAWALLLSDAGMTSGRVIVSNYTVTATYTSPSSLSAASPTVGTASGGTVVTVTGTGLSGVTDVTFGGVAATGVVAAADGLSVTCVTPAHAGGTVDVAVAGVGTLTGAFTYVAVTRVTPATGTFAGGTPVTLSGSGFSPATGVTFGDAAATSVVVVSDTTITAVTPVHALGAVDVTVVGVGTGTGLYTYTYGAAAVKLPPIPYQSPVTQTGTNPTDILRAEWVRWLQAVKQRVEQGPMSEIPASQVIGELAPSQIPELPWGRITKSGASVSDLQHPGIGANGQYLAVAGSTPVWRTFGAAPMPVNFDPGTCTISAAQFLAFPGYVMLSGGEALTMGVGAVLRVF